MSNSRFYGDGDTDRQQLNDELKALENDLRKNKKSPNYLAPWFINTQNNKNQEKAENAKRENYYAYNSIRFANSIGKDLGKISTDDSSSKDETIGIAYLNDKVKAFNQSLKESKNLLKNTGTIPCQGNT